MTKEEIIGILQECGCESCLETIKFINRQQAENENLKDILYDADGVNLVNYWYQQCKIAENGCKNFQEENEKLQAENEWLKASRDKWKEIATIFDQAIRDKDATIEMLEEMVGEE